MSALAELLGAMRDTPRLSGARCVGLSELFDPPPIGTELGAQAEHTAAAVAICTACPALMACRAWLDGLTPSARPAGVVAGRLSTPGPRRRRKARADLYEALDAALCADPGATDVDTAARVGCSPETVAKARLALETAGQIPHVRRKGGRKPKTLQQNGIPA